MTKQKVAVRLRLLPDGTRSEESLILSSNHSRTSFAALSYRCRDIYAVGVMHE